MVQKSTPKKKKKETVLPAYLVYEEIDGKALPYKGFKEVLAKTKKVEEIMGSGALQSFIVSLVYGFLFTHLDRKKYFPFTNEAGLHLEKGNNLANDIAVYSKSLGKSLLQEKYMNTPPIVAIEVDTKIEFDEETFDSPQFYMLAKSQKLLDFGTEKVVWILTESKKIFVIIPGKEWKIVDFDTDIPILDDCVLNLAKLLEEEGVEYKW